MPGSEEKDGGQSRKQKKDEGPAMPPIEELNMMFNQLMVCTLVM
jgi:hypothetical protein